MLKRNSVKVYGKHSTPHWQLTQQKWQPAGRTADFGNFLNGFAKSPRLIVLNIDWVQFVLPYSVRGLYDK